jgi:phage repressor protein C with HTH and peptisase S24 domain
MSNFLSKNLKYLRQKAGYVQDDFDKLGIKKATYSNYENGNTEPKIEVLIKLSKFLGVEVGALISKDLTIVKDYQLPGSIPVEGFTVQEPVKQHLNVIPIIEIEAAAGIGTYNNDHIEILGHLTVPENSLQRHDARYFAIRTRGHSMSPTIFDKDYLIVRHLERAEWQSLRDEYVYVVVDGEGKSYVKRIKDRMNRGFVVCMSDNLDKGNYPNFTLEEGEIMNLFYVELKMSPHLPNINSTYYDRMKLLEDRVDELVAWRARLDK